MGLSYNWWWSLPNSFCKMCSQFKLCLFMGHDRYYWLWCCSTGNVKIWNLEYNIYIFLSCSFIITKNLSFDFLKTDFGQISRTSSLQHLNIGGTFITDESLFAIAERCHNLKVTTNNNINPFLFEIIQITHTNSDLFIRFICRQSVCGVADMWQREAFWFL